MPVSIKDSVGREGENDAPDVCKVQTLLNSVFPLTPLEVDGKIGPRTIARIERVLGGAGPGREGRRSLLGRELDHLQGLGARPVLPEHQAGRDKARERPCLRLADFLGFT